MNATKKTNVLHCWSQKNIDFDGSCENVVNCLDTWVSKFYKSNPAVYNMMLENVLTLGNQILLLCTSHRRYNEIENYVEYLGEHLKKENKLGVMVSILEIILNQHTACIDEIIAAHTPSTNEKQNKNLRFRKKSADIDRKTNQENDEKQEKNKENEKESRLEIKFESILKDKDNRLWFTFPILNTWLNIFLLIVSSQYSSYRDNFKNASTIKNGSSVLFPFAFQIKNQPLFVYFLNLLSNIDYTSMLPVKKMLIFVRWHICMYSSKIVVFVVQG